MTACQDWPEPVIRVQALAASGLATIPERFIKPKSQRPTNSNNYAPKTNSSQIGHHKNNTTNSNIPVIDMKHIYGGDEGKRAETLRLVSEACQEWGFFQVVNHGVSHELMKGAREVWREFFHQPLDVKEVYANTPLTYEGYGSRLGVKKGAILDWSDYFFLHYMPCSLRDQAKWPALPTSLRYVPPIIANVKKNIRMFWSLM